MTSVPSRAGGFAIDRACPSEVQIAVELGPRRASGTEGADFPIWIWS